MSCKVERDNQQVNRCCLDKEENKNYAALPEDANAWFMYSKQLGEKMDMRGAVNALSRAIALEPTCGIYYRWRGHRHLNCGDIEDACADFTMASRLIPDNWDVWYHLALTCVVLGRREYAEYAHKKCWELTNSHERGDDSKRIALCNWRWINLSLMGYTEEADALLEKYIRPDLDAGVDVAYLRMCLAYKGDLPLESLLEKKNEDEALLSTMTQAFGLANYYLVKGDDAKYRETIDFIVNEGKSAWNCFGYASACYIKRHMQEA